MLYQSYLQISPDMVTLQRQREYPELETAIGISYAY